MSCCNVNCHVNCNGHPFKRIRGEQQTREQEKDACNSENLENTENPENSERGGPRER